MSELVKCCLDMCGRSAVGSGCGDCGGSFCGPHTSGVDHFCQQMIHNRMTLGCDGCTALRDLVTQLWDDKERLQARNHHLVKQNRELKHQLQSHEGDLFHSKQEADQAIRDATLLKRMQHEHRNLSQQLVTLGEMYQSAKETIDAMNSTSFTGKDTMMALDLRNESLELEVDWFKEKVKGLTQERDHYRSLCLDLEQDVTHRKVTMEETVKCHQEVLRRERESCDTLTHTNKRLEGIIKDLNVELGRKQNPDGEDNDSESFDELP